jgi:O-antigen ligase
VKAVRHRTLLIALVALGIVGMLLASGRQGVVILLVSVSVLLWFRRRTLFMLAIGPAIAIAMWLNWDSVFGTFTRGQPERLSNLSGRVGWWESAIDAWAAHPWTGYGFGAGGRFVALANLGNGRTSNVHSGYVEALVGVGLMGVIPLVIAVLLVSAWSFGALKDGRDVPFAILIVAMVIHTAVARGFGAWLSAEVVLLVCLVGITDWRRRDREATRTSGELVSST